MSHNRIVLLLGSNLGDQKINLITALSHIEREIGEVEKKSEVIKSVAEDFESENIFYNQTLTLSTVFSPMSILDKVKEIELAMGRVYNAGNQRFQDRVIDIDILTFNEVKFKSKRLVLPHPQIKARVFIKRLLN
ncbi:MAG: 2-amino-4-hydroxy-6-hydroxymethyldihydropteridine diphosphokinase [Weeksellaceae bacterium]